MFKNFSYRKLAFIAALTFCMIVTLTQQEFMLWLFTQHNPSDVFNLKAEYAKIAA
jgi:hypothetical protein